jgi:putative zinc finger/helix-turn-helix YgiT family protein
MGPEAPQTVSAEVRGDTVGVTITAPKCGECGHVAILGKTFRIFTRAAADSYRRLHNLLTVEEMERVRKQLGMTREEFAEYVFVGIATFKRWLRGEIQSLAYDKLVRLRTDLQCLERSQTELVERLTAASPALDTSSVYMAIKSRVKAQAESAPTCEQSGMAA